MLTYEKKVNGARKLFGTHDNVPAADDAELVYRDVDGNVLPLVPGDAYLDNGHGGIIRKSDGKFIGVFIGNDQKAIAPKDWQPSQLEEVKEVAKPVVEEPEIVEPEIVEEEEFIAEPVEEELFNGLFEEPKEVEE